MCATYVKLNELHEHIRIEPYVYVATVNDTSKVFDIKEQQPR